MWTNDVIYADKVISDPVLKKFYETNPQFSQQYMKKALQLSESIQRYRDTRSIKPDHISKVVLKLTHACNMRCEMCFQWRETGLDNTSTLGFHRNVKRSAISFNDCHHLFDFLEKNPCDVVLTGGEPMVHRDFPQYVEKLVQLGCFIYICTNGSLIEKHYDVLSQYHDRLAFLISIDGPKAIHDGIRGKGFFEKTINAISRMAADKQNNGAQWIIGIEATMMEKNLDHIEDIVQIAETAGVDWMVFNHLWIVNAEARAEYAAYCKNLDIHPPYSFDGYDIGNFSEAYIDKVIAASAQARSLQKKIPIYQNPAFSNEEIRLYYKGLLKPRNDYPKLGVKFDVNIDGSLVLSKQFPEISFGNIADTPIEEILMSKKYSDIASEMTDKPLGILNACPDLHNLRT